MWVSCARRDSKGVSFYDWKEVETDAGCRCGGPHAPKLLFKGSSSGILLFSDEDESVKSGVGL